VLVPTTIGYLVLGRPLAVTLFQQGNFTHENAVATGGVIAVAGLGLLPFAISQLQLFAFYAMPDTKTPALINLPVVGLRIAVDILLYVVLPAGAVAAGLMAGNVVSYLLAAVLGYLLLRRRIGSLELRRVFSTLGKLSAAGVIAGIPTLLVVVGLESITGESKLAGLVQLLAGGAVLLVGYVGMSFVLKVPEMRELSTMVRSRLGR
jgi:putative peptidoglycan lipid II flippase